MRSRQMRSARVVRGLLGAALVALGTTVVGQAPQIPAAPTGQAPVVDLSGYWTPTLHEDLMERGPGAELADYGGFPLNEAGRLWALSYDPSRVTLRHHQCEAYVTPYQMRALGNFRIWEERDPHTQQLVAIHLWAPTTDGHTALWMDARPPTPRCACAGGPTAPASRSIPARGPTPATTASRTSIAPTTPCRPICSGSSPS